MGWDHHASLPFPWPYRHHGLSIVGIEAISHGWATLARASVLECGGKAARPRHRFLRGVSSFQLSVSSSLGLVHPVFIRDISEIRGGFPVFPKRRRRCALPAHSKTWRERSGLRVVGPAFWSAHFSAALPFVSATRTSVGTRKNQIERISCLGT